MDLIVFVQPVGLSRLEHNAPDGHRFENRLADISSSPDVAQARPRVCFPEVAGESCQLLS